MKHAVHFSSQRLDWATPDEFFEKLNAVFRFTVDACATSENAKLPKFWTLKDDGLRQDWSQEIVWLNPPYGREIGLWTAKAKTAKACVALLPARTDTRWWHRDIQNQAHVCFLVGRIRFKGAAASAPFPSILAFWGPFQSGLSRGAT